MAERERDDAPHEVQVQAIWLGIRGRRRSRSTSASSPAVEPGVHAEIGRRISTPSRDTPPTLPNSFASVKSGRRNPTSTSCSVTCSPSTWLATQRLSH
jgi:hypothetical protein